MKKLTAMLLGFVMVLSLVACSGSDESQKEPPVTDDEEEYDVSAFEEVTVVDNEQCVVKITGIDPDNMWGYTVNVYVENKSTEKTYMFSVEEASVDGVATDPLFATEVTPGNKDNSSINFMDTELEKNGIQFTEIDLNFRVFDSNDFMAEPVAQESVKIYPMGEEVAEAYVREDKDTDIVIVDNDSLKMVVTGNYVDEIFGYTLEMYIINKSDVELMISADDVAVNGYMMEPLFARSVPAGKSAFTSMYWSTSEFEENNITEVEEVTFTLTASDANDWLADALVNESIKLNP